MSESTDREWTIKFPIEATAFVGVLILVAVLSAGVFLLGGLQTTSINRGVGFGRGGFVDQPIEDVAPGAMPVPEGRPVITTVAP